MGNLKGIRMSSNQNKIDEYEVTGMTCDHCVAAVREEVAELPGVEMVEVDLQTGRLTAGPSPLDEEAVIAAVEEAGYTARRIG